MGMVLAWVGGMGGQWRQLYLNNNKKERKNWSTFQKIQQPKKKKKKTQPKTSKQTNKKQKPTL